MHEHGLVVRSGAGAVVRADRVNVRHIREAVVRMISEPEGRRGAKRLARSFDDLDSSQNFRNFVSEIFVDGLARPTESPKQESATP